MKKTIRIRWVREDQYTILGLIRTGEERDCPADLAEPWLRGGWAEEIQGPTPEIKAKKKITEV